MVITARHILTACILALAYISPANAGAAGQQVQVQMWEPSEERWPVVVTSGVALRKADGTRVVLSAVQLTNFRDAQLKIMEQSALRIPLVFTDEPDANGYATMNGERLVVAITFPLVALVGDDRDAVAALLGHEFAHHKMGHTGQERGNRESATGAIGSLLGGLANNYVPFGRAVVGAAVAGIGRSFTRDEERAADNLGLDWAIASGYDPCGSYRLAQKLGGGAGVLQFLSTHPGPEERLANAEGRSIALNGRGCMQPIPTATP